MKTNKEIYQDAFRSLHISEDFQMEVQTMKRSKWVRMNQAATYAAMAACILALGAGAVFAAVRLLSPSEIARQLGNQKLESAFQSDDAVLINETQTFENYQVTLLGLVSGKDLSDFIDQDEDEISPERSYVVTAIERTDGKEMSYEDTFFINPYVNGYNKLELNIASLQGGYSAILSEDQKAIYFISNMNSIEPFADHVIHLGVQDGGVFSPDENGQAAFLYDPENGTYHVNPDYRGVNAFFELPVDPDKADPEKAAKILSDIVERMDEDNSEDIRDAEDVTIYIQEREEKGEDAH